jgi:hypothetical protein
LALGFLASVSNAGEKDLRDEVYMKDGTVHKGRVTERYSPEELILYTSSGQKKLKQDRIQKVYTVRDRLQVLLSKHIPGLSADEEWELVELAQELKLPEMARLQALQTVLADPSHEKAHKLLGHKTVKAEYRWPAGKKGRQLSLNKYEESIQEWPDRLKLESEHYALETNTSIRQAVDLLFDLEYVYLCWMDEYGESLNAGEDVFYADLDDHKMTFHVFRTREDKGFTEQLNPKIRQAYYSPSRDVATAKGNPNLVFTYFRPNSLRAEDLFNLAVQQLMYSTLILSRKTGNLPATRYVRHSHWAEVGMGYWFGRRFTGNPGYAQPLSFYPEEGTIRLARLRVTDGPMARHYVTREITNLIGLPFSHFFEGDNIDIHHAKACNLFRFLMEEDPPVLKGNKVVGSGKDGLEYYLREVYVHATGHSSSAFDKGLSYGKTKAKVEWLQNDWVRWRNQ